MACVVRAQYEHRTNDIWQADVEYRPDRIVDLIPNFEYTLAQATNTSTAAIRRWCDEHSAIKGPNGEAEYSSAAIMNARWFADRGYDWVPFRDGPYDRGNVFFYRFQIIAWIKTNDAAIHPTVWSHVDDVREDCCPVHVGWPLEDPRGRRWCSRGEHQVAEHPHWSAFGSGGFTPAQMTVPEVRERAGKV